MARARARVILRHCDQYDAEQIAGIIGEGLDELGVRPHGRTLIKPNLVIAGPRFEPAWTRVEFAEGVIRALKERGEAVSELAVGERCAITVPSRFVFAEAGYDPMLEAHEVTRYCFDETPQVEVPLTHERRLRDAIFVPQPIAQADFFVNLPKFKAHPWTTVSFSLKNYIGIQDDRHRMIDHDHALNRKVADLQHVVQPRFVAIDAIVAGEGSTMLAPKPRRLNLIIMGSNQVAVDSVGCHILGLDPASVEHIRLAHEDGFGPINLADLELTGDVSLEQAQLRAADYDVGLKRVEKLFEGSRINAYAGPPPEHDRTGYCWGGCPGALEEAVAVLKRFDAEGQEDMPRMHFVFGDYQGPIEMSYGERVVFVGDCVRYEGSVGGQPVRVESLYRDRSTLDPRAATHEDIFQKMLATAEQLIKAKDQPYLRLAGCPVSVANLILVLAELGGLKNPYFVPDQAVPFARHYLAWRAQTLVNRLQGRPYHVQGKIERGGAAPSVDAPSVAPH